jgi:RNA polymerase sigma-70 factor (ECF subfamily)
MALGTRFDSTLTAAQAGADWALAALYSEFQPRLLRYLLAQAPSEAEDLATEVWIDAARGLRRFEGDEPAFGRWLFTIVHRRLVDFRRRSARRREVPLSVEAVAHASGTDWVREPAGDDAALACLAALPPAYAEIVLLRIVGGFRADEVAQITGRKPGTIRVMQKRALERLAEHLAETSTELVTQ